MPRKKLPQIASCPFHIVARTVNKEPFPIEIEKVWEILCDELSYCCFTYDLKILSFVLMPNHFHLLAASETQPLANSMLHFMKVTALRINRECGRKNHLWGSEYWRTLLSENNYYFNTYKYIYQNPVRAGFCTYCEAWPFSSLHQILGFSKMQIPIQEDSILFPDSFDERSLKWLNTPINPVDLSDIRSALKRSTFKYPRKKGFQNDLFSRRI